MTENYDDEEVIVVGNALVDTNALLGVVRPAGYLLDDEAPEDRPGRPFEDAHNKAVQALVMTQERLTSLRKQRADINAEIKTLVDDEDLLIRMTRVRKGSKSGQS